MFPRMYTSSLVGLHITIVRGLAGAAAIPLCTSDIEGQRPFNATNFHKYAKKSSSQHKS